MLQTLLISYILIPFVILYFYNQELYFDLNNIIKLFIIFFNSFIMYLVAIEKHFYNNLSFVQYISFINIYTIVLSFITNNYKYLLLIRYISWLYTCPYMILYVFNKNTDDVLILFNNYNNKLLYFIVLLLIINIINYIYISNTILFLKYTVSIIFVYFFNYINDNGNVYNNENFVFLFNIILIIYSIFQMIYDAKILNVEKLYFIYSLLDIFTKFIFIFYKNLKHSNNLSYRTFKVIKMIQPTVKKALMNNIITKEDYDNFFKLYNINDKNLKNIQNEYLKEIFPNSSSFDNLFNNNELFTVMDNMIILFCDMVKYTEFVNNNSFDVIVPYINNYFCKIDSLVEKYKIIKVEIIGDAYLMISKNIDDILSCAFELINKFNDKIRIGIHTGNIACCNIGITKIRTSYIGHSINFSARLESTSKPGKIHISNEIVTLLNSNNNKFNYKYIITKRNEPIELKGIGTYNTFFIE